MNGISKILFWSAAIINNKRGNPIKAPPSNVIKAELKAEPRITRIEPTIPNIMNNLTLSRRSLNYFSSSILN